MPTPTTAAKNFTTTEIAELTIALDKVGRAIGDMNDEAYDAFAADIPRPVPQPERAGQQRPHPRRTSRQRVNLIDDLRDVWE